MASSNNVEIVTDTDTCLPIVEHLLKLDFIALDAEGINLGKEGPLTLLQIGTVDEKVYLFDIATNKEILRKGNLKDVLQSEKLVKVADLIISENKGQIFPPTLKLSDICQKYSDNPQSLDQKDKLKVKWTNEDGELWARRPLTAEMIEYASNDVTALIPTVYNNQKRLLEENKLLPEYKTRVEDEINYYIDEAASKIKQTRIDESVNCILKDIGTKYNKDTKFLDITDEDDIYAIHHVRYEAEVVSPFIKQLKIESIKLRLQELSDQLSTEGNNFIPKARSYKFLRAYQYLPDRDIQTYAKRLQKTLDTLFLACMEKKYSLDTHINFIAPYEKDALQSIRPRNPHDSTIDPIILSLYWQKQEKDIDFEIENLQITGRSYSIPQGRYKWLKYNCSAKVPYNVQMKAKRYIDNLDKTFGKGNYSA